MKKTILILSAVAVLGFTACKQELLPENALKDNGTTFIFTSAKPALEEEESTKTHWTGTTIWWSEDDQMRMAYTVDDVWQGASDESTTPKLYASQRLSEASEIATFTINSYFTATAEGPHIFYGLYPGSLVSSTDFSQAPKASINIPAEQTPSTNSFDSNADVMIGKSEVFAEKPSDAILLTWKRQVAHADLTIYNLTINSGETIEGITFTAQDGADLVGMHDIDITTGQISNPQGTTNVISVNAENLTYSDNSIKVWISMLPATITALTVKVETDKAYYERSFSSISRTFVKNKHNTMRIGMSTVTRTEKPQNLGIYEEAFENTLGDFTVEKENLPAQLTYVWQKTSSYGAKGSAYVSGTKYAATSYLVSPELRIGSTNSKLTFDQAANQLGGGSFDTYFSVVVFDGETENTLALDVKPAGNNWNFVSSSVSLAAYNGKTIKIGFKYTSTNTVAGTWEIKNFKVTDVKVKQSPELSFGENTSFEVEIGDDFTAPTLSNPHNLAVTYSSNNEDVAVVDENTGEIILGDEEGTATITASFGGDEDYLAGTASYTITLVDPNAVDYVTLDWDYAGGTAADLNAVVGVTTDGLGSDYAAQNAPYRVKFDNSGDYIQVKTDVAIGTVSVSYKMLGGASTSYLNIFESIDGTTWGERIDRLTISGASNSTGTLTTVADFNSTSRFVRIVFDKGSNVGIGAISIHKPDTTPIIITSDINNVPAVGVEDQEVTEAYTVKNFTDDVRVAEYTGCVTDASVTRAGTIEYSVAPNYSTTAKTGTIVLESASDNSVTATINVSQLKSTLSVSITEVIIPADATTASFTVTTAEFGYNAIVASTETGMNLTIFSGASGSANASAQTVTVSSTTAAPTSGDAITLGTISVYRNGNASDSQKKTITIKKAIASTGGSYYVKVSSITSGKKYLMVDNTYSKIFNSSSPTQPSVGIDASSLISSNGIESTSTTDSYAVTITSDGAKYKVLLSTGNYLVINSSSNSNGSITSSLTGESITITKVTEGFKFISGNRSTRALVYRSGYDFRNYAASNIGTSGYGGYFDLYELTN